MLSRTQVINNGLRMISANLIADPDEDTESARQAKGVYEQVVRGELEAHAWSFAKQSRALPALATPPSNTQYLYAYNLPSDFLRLVEIDEKWVFTTLRNVDTNPRPLYEIQGREIYTNLGSPLLITYIRDMSEDPTLWTALFSNVVSAALAVALAMSLTKSEGIVTMAQKFYEKEITRARRSNAIQLPPQFMPDNSWITARFM